MKNRGLPPPGEGSDVIYDVVYCRPHSPIEATILDEHLLGLAVHWVEEKKVEGGREVKYRRTRLCTIEGGCKWCGSSPDAVWAGYVGCFVHGVNKPQIVLVSPDAGRQLVGREVAFYGLRGQRVQIRRDKDLIRGRMIVEKSLFPALDPLPAAFAIEPTLRVVFGCYRLPSEEVEGADPFGGGDAARKGLVDDRLPWEKRGAE